MTSAAATTAHRVLDANWIGASTKPSAHLYPHQWSWDSAFIAIGNAARGRVDRAILELDTLFAAQWSNGMVPHMVFDMSAADYHPSPEVWGTRTITAMPEGVVTSGMVQPAVHALAVRRVADAAEPNVRRAFLERIVPRLEAWHAFLHTARSVDGLVEIHHPWESGMDNSPLWDAALAAIDLDRLPVPEYQRVDTDHAPASERPTDAHYDRYMAILEALRIREYQPDDPDELPFRIADVLTNTMLAAADLELAGLQVEIGSDSAGALARAARLTTAMQQQLWSDELGIFLDVDRCTGQPIRVRTAAGLLPLLLDLEPTTAERLLGSVRSMSVDGPTGRVVPTVAPDDPTFEARRYWRGPVWINITWLLIEACRARPAAEPLVRALRSGVLDLVERSGCHEYFDPFTADPLGASGFSWTAALTLDLDGQERAAQGSRRSR